MQESFAYAHIQRMKRLCRGRRTWPNLFVKANPEHCAAMQRGWPVGAHDYIAAHLLHCTALLHLIHLSPNKAPESPCHSCITVRALA